MAYAHKYLRGPFDKTVVELSVEIVIFFPYGHYNSQFCNSTNQGCLKYLFTAVPTSFPTF